MKKVKWNNSKATYSLLILAFIITTIVIIHYPNNLKIKEKKTDKTFKFNPNKIALKAQRNLAQNFFNTVSFKSEVTNKITFGNKKIGFFETTNFEYSDGKIKMELIPPSYIDSIEFFVANKKVFEKKFIPFKSQIFKNFKIRVIGSFNAPFYLLTGIMHIGRYDEFNRAVFPIIVNKLGEIIWAHIPNKGDRNFKKYLTSKMINSSKIANLYSEQSSYFEVIDLKGNLEYEFSGKEQVIPVVIHHDFHWDEHKKILTTFSNYIKNFRLWHEDHSLLQNIIDFIKNPISFVSSSVISIDLNNNTIKTLTTGIDHFPIFKGELTEYFLSYLSNIKESVWATWKKRVQYDHLHANSLQKTDIGWFVSYRNLNKVVMYNNDFSKVLWTVGADNDSTYVPYGPKHSFYHQHHATYLQNGEILLVDNHPSPPAPNKIGTRVLKFSRTSLKKFKVNWNYQPHYNFKSQTRGSAELIKNKNILVFYPESLSGGDQLIEIDYKTGLPIAHMNISFFENKTKISQKQAKYFNDNNILVPDVVRVGGGNRAVPIYNLNNSSFMENKND